MTRLLTLRAGMALSGMILLAACNRDAPSGQVAATVNGDEVTLQEVNAEVQASNFPATIEKKVAQRIALQRVIDRKLVIKAAADKGLDKTPEYLGQKRRDDELLLAQLYARQQLAAVPVPTDADISKFMAEHGNAFSGRQELVMDQIRFAMPKDPGPLKALESAHTMADVGATLTRLNIKYERGAASLDSATVPANIMTALNKLPPTEPFALPSQGLMTINVITARKPIANDDRQARAAAVSAWRQEKFAALLTQQVTSLKSGTKINYQNGFGPPPANAGTPGATPATGSAPTSAPAAAPKG